MTRSGRPRATGLSRPAIVKAALAQANESGLDGLTMRALAKRLGADPTAVYRYFSSKDDVLAALVDTALSDLEQAPAGGGLAITAEALALSFRAVLRRNPGVVPLMLTDAPLTAPQVHATAVALDALMRAGLSAADAVAAYQALYAYVIGFVAQEVAAEGRALGVAEHQAEALALARHELGDRPAAELSAIAAGTAFPSGGVVSFLAGLRLLLTGLAVTYDVPPSEL